MAPFVAGEGKAMMHFFATRMYYAPGNRLHYGLAMLLEKCKQNKGLIAHEFQTNTLTQTNQKSTALDNYD